MDYRLRSYNPEDLPFLWNILYEAACWRPDAVRPPRDEVLSLPENAIYLEGFGRRGDDAVVAEDKSSGERLGAVWHRLTTPEKPGYGFIDPEVPELGLGVVQSYRGNGIGGALLSAMIERARADSFEALSLSVEEDNPATRLYERHGFEKLSNSGNAWIMKADLGE